MKKIITLFLSLILLLGFSVSIYAVEFEDSDTGATFSVPDGWAEIPTTDTDAEAVKFKFVSSSQKAIFEFGSADYYDSLSAEERAKTKRSDVVFSKSDAEQLAEAFGADAADVTYVNGFYCFPVDQKYDFGTNSMIMWCRFDNAIVYIFIFLGEQTGVEYQEFKEICKSFKAGIPEEIVDNSAISSSAATTPKQSSYSSAYSTYDSGYRTTNIAADIFLSVLITLGIIVFPIVIYRYAIKKNPVAPPKAKKITIVYGIVALVIFTIFAFVGVLEKVSVAPIFLWSYINYRILSSGYEEPSKMAGGEPEERPLAPLEIPEENPVIGAVSEGQTIINVSSGNELRTVFEAELAQEKRHTENNGEVQEEKAKESVIELVGERGNK